MEVPENVDGVDSETEFRPSEWPLRAELASAIRSVANSCKLAVAGLLYLAQTIMRPGRRKKSGKGVSGIFPSTKTGLTLGFKARTTEYAFVLDQELSIDSIACFNEPPHVKLNYMCAKTHRMRSYQHAPDFLVVKRDSIELVDCMGEAELLEKSKKQPELYERDVAGTWRCKPVEEAAGELGMRHRIVTGRDISPIKVGNLHFLMDYVRVGQHHWNAVAAKAIRDYLYRNGRTKIFKLLADLSSEVTPDDLYRSIALSRVCADLDDELLTEPDRSYVYFDYATMISYGVLRRAAASSRQVMAASTVIIGIGTKLNWDGHRFEVLNNGESEFTLLDVEHPDVVRTLTRDLFEKLFKAGAIKPDSDTAERVELGQSAAYALMRQASPADLGRALASYRLIEPYLRGVASSPERTERRKLASWREAVAKYGNGFVGLIPAYTRSANRDARMDPSTQGIVKEQTKAFYANPKRIRIKHLFSRIKSACEEAGVHVPCYSYVARYVKKRQFEMKLAREGSRSAYGLEPRVDAPADAAPPHAARAFEKAYVDHTQIDEEVVCSKTGKNLGRPWLTVMIDDSTAKVLAYYLTFRAPSNRSVLMVMRDCVKRWGRLPEILLVDNGAEFHSTWFELIAAFFNMTIQWRPAAKSRFASRGERFFGTVNTSFFYNLLGNTQNRRNARQMTPDVDPSETAVWTFKAIRTMFDRFLDYYHDLEHTRLLITPNEAFERSVRQHGSRPERRIVYDRDFLISTCPSTPKGTVKVQPDGVKINYLYYYSPALGQALGDQVPVRYEPLDMSIAYAFIRGAWVTLRARSAETLTGRTEYELTEAREEWLRRRSQVENIRLNETRFVKFLKELDNSEALLMVRLRTLAERNVEQGDFGGFEDEDEIAGADPVRPNASPARPVQPSAPAVRVTSDQLITIAKEQP